MFKRGRSVVYAGGLLLGVALLSSGCRTTRIPGVDSLAAVQFTNCPPLDIAREISRVFVGAGFSTVPQQSTRDMRLVFERRASTGTDILYSDWSFKGVWIRAKVRITSTGPECFLVTCDVFRVLNRNDSHFEEEHRLSSVHARDYQRYLENARQACAADRQP